MTLSIGRKNTVITTLMIMGLATVGVGLPTYSQIGAMAPILLVLLRVIQGIAMGGEWGGAVLIATEFAPLGKKILYGAFAQPGSPVGNMLATGAFLGLTYMRAENFGSCGWRIPLLMSAILIGTGLYIRLHITASPEMIRATQQTPQQRIPLVTLLRDHWRVVSLAVGAVVTGVAITYLKPTFTMSWATTELDFGRTTVLQIVTVALVAQAIIQPCGAVQASRIDAKKAILIMLLPEFVLLPLMFLLIQTGSFGLAALGMVLATAPHAMYYSALVDVLAKLSPTRTRYTGISVAYELSTGFVFSTAQFTCRSGHVAETDESLTGAPAASTAVVRWSFPPTKEPHHELRVPGCRRRAAACPAGRDGWQEPAGARAVRTRGRAGRCDHLPPQLRGALAGRVRGVRALRAVPTGGCMGGTMCRRIG